MSWEDRITVDPKILAGKPIVSGTRLSVEFILDLIAAGWSWDRLLAEYPQLTDADLRAVAAYAAMVVKGEQAHAIGA